MFCSNGQLSRIKISLTFSEPELAQTIADSEPPDGVKVSKSKTILECHAPGEIFKMVVMEFAPQFSATLLAGWILLELGKHGKKSARINRKDIALKKRDVLRLIQEEIAKQDTQKPKRKRKK